MGTETSNLLPVKTSLFIPPEKTFDVRGSRNKYCLRQISNLKTYNTNAFSNETPKPFKRCNKNMMQQSLQEAGSKCVQVDRKKMQKASKRSGFTVLQGK